MENSPADATIDTLPVTVVLLVLDKSEIAFVASALSRLGWARHVVLADAVGVPADILPTSVNLIRVSGIGLSPFLLRYRGALAAPDDGLVFLSPLDFIAEKAVSQVAGDLTHWCHRFQRSVSWHDVRWPITPTGDEPDLVYKPYFLKQREMAKPLPVKILPTGCTALIPPGQESSWVNLEAETQARQYLLTHGTVETGWEIFSGWLWDVFVLGIAHGILEGQWFSSSTSRASLLLRLDVVHRKWQKLSSWRFILDTSAD